MTAVLTPSELAAAIGPSDVRDVLARSILADGLDFILDIDRSSGSYLVDARTGERLWYFAGNDRVYASPMTYLANGKQYMSLAVGDVIATFGLD